MRHVGSSSLTRDRTQAPCIGSVELWPWDYQGSPSASLLSTHVQAPLGGPCSATLEGIPWGPGDPAPITQLPPPACEPRCQVGPLASPSAPPASPPPACWVWPRVGVLRGPSPAALKAATLTM